MHTHGKVLMIHKDIEYEMSLRMDHPSENPTRTNHVNAYGKWKEFAKDCNFDYDKMFRFKYIQTVEGDNGDEDSVLVFHVC